MGLPTSIDLGALLPTAQFLSGQLGHEVPALLPRPEAFPVDGTRPSGFRSAAAACVTCWPGRREESPVALAVHGITANSRAWDVARARRRSDGPGARPARSRTRASLPGPYGMAEHAADLVAVLDHLGVARALVLGHSMGAFVPAWRRSATPTA